MGRSSLFFLENNLLLMPLVAFGLSVDFLPPACPEVIRDCSGTVASDAKIRPPPLFGRHTDRTAAISAFLIINKHYHIPTIGGPYSLVVLMSLVTWQGKSHVNSATSISNHLVTDGQNREIPLRGGAHGRRAKPPGADLFFTMALGAGARDQRYDMGSCRVGDLDLCVTCIIGATRRSSIG